ncbi:MAG: hypothetical protein J7496_04155 [Novosphingobium sp.]|nr:hypothetical protein [Novosphingobium sp.]MBO9601685.1 hypothetical protein [Novosphingobium sp.]
MSVKLTLERDTLDEATRRFAPPPIAAPIFLNSVPKSGTHLLRNILRMFVPVEQQYHKTFLQWPNLQDNLAAFSAARPMLSWGHLLFSDASAFETAGCRRVILVRDPYDWVLARARFFVSEQFSANLDHLKGGALSIEDLMNLMIFGIHGKAAALAEQYRFNAVAWLHTGALMLRYEELVRHANATGTPEAEAYFAALFEHCGVAMPANWAERVTTGADRRQSATAREKLALGKASVPDELPEGQKRLVELAAPGLRAFLGYS